MTNRNDRHFYRQEATQCICDVDEPFGDKREGTCCKCGRQVDGRPIPAAGVFSLGVSDDRSSFAHATRKYRPAA